MNYAPRVFDQLAREGGYAEVVLAPGSRPAFRGRDGLRTWGEQRLTAEDVHETLTTLAARVGGNPSTLDRDGVFSFGIPNRGRFRVAYLTQRASYVVSITEIPLDVPDLADVVSDPESAKDIESRVLTGKPGLIVLSGRATLAVNQLAYALIKRVNETRPLMVSVLEPFTTYILRHDQSIVVQAEAGSDAASLEQGIVASTQLNPDILYVRGVSSESEMKAVARAVKQQVLTLLVVSSGDLATLFPPDRPPLVDPAMLHGIWKWEQDPKSRKLVAVS